MSCSNKSPTTFAIQHLLFTIHLLSLLTVSTQYLYSSDDILSDLSPFIIIYKNGTIQRLIETETIPPSFDPTTKVHSKDINIPNLVSARIYLPEKSIINYNQITQKLPLLIYIHGGAFFTGSAFSPTYHHYLNSLASKANVIAISLNYRLAPENPLPIGYQDSWRALKWVLSHRFKSGSNETEPWLKKYADFGRVYLGGDSAGGNIAHNMAIRVGLDETGRGFLIDGMFLNCPHFWGNRAIGNEDSDPKGEALMEGIWVNAYPNSTGFDDPLSNPGMDPDLWKLGCKRVLVYVAEKDVLRDRGWLYGESLRKSKWNGVVRVVEIEGENHVFNLGHPENPKAKMMMEQLALFLNDQDRKRGYVSSV